MFCIGLIVGLVIGILVMVGYCLYTAVSICKTPDNTDKVYDTLMAIKNNDGCKVLVTKDDQIIEAVELEEE